MRCEVLASGNLSMGLRVAIVVPSKLKIFASSKTSDSVVVSSNEIVIKFSLISLKFTSLSMAFEISLDELLVSIQIVSKN